MRKRINKHKRLSSRKKVINLRLLILILIFLIIPVIAIFVAINNTDLRSRAATKDNKVTLTTQDFNLGCTTPGAYRCLDGGSCQRCSSDKSWSNNCDAGQILLCQTLNGEPQQQNQTPPNSDRPGSKENPPDEDKIAPNQPRANPPPVESTKEDTNSQPAENPPPSEEKSCSCLANITDSCVNSDGSQAERIPDGQCSPSQTACCRKTGAGLQQQSSKSFSARMIETISKWLGL